MRRRAESHGSTVADVAVRMQLLEGAPLLSHAALTRANAGRSLRAEGSRRKQTNMRFFHAPDFELQLPHSRFTPFTHEAARVV